MRQWDRVGAGWGGDAGSSSGAEGESGQGAKTKLTVWIMPNSPQNRTGTS